jgi:membrane protease YdiL (CAAX protease family)/LysM repeat protein
MFASNDDMARLAILYLFLIIIAELLATAYEPVIGVALHTLILLSLILQGALARQVQKRRFLLALALSPLIRIISVTVPLNNRPIVEWYLVIGGLMYIATFFTIRATEFAPRRIGMTFKDWPKQVALGAIGLGLGLVEYLIIRPAAIIPKWDPVVFLQAALTLLICTGVLEEIIFRGLLQEASLGPFGRFGIIYSAAVFAVLHLGYLSIIELIFVFSVAILFGYLVVKTHSLLGVSIAHGLINICLYLVFPLLALQFGSTTATTELPHGPLAPVSTSAYLPGWNEPAAATPIVLTPGSGTLTPSPAPGQPTLGPATLPPTVTPLQAATATSAPTVSSTTQCGSPAGWIQYSIRPGDTLYGLSLATGATVAQIQQANCMGSNTVLAVGQLLYLPSQPVIPPTATTVLLPTVTASPVVEAPTDPPTAEVPASETETGTP